LRESKKVTCEPPPELSTLTIIAQKKLRFELASIIFAAVATHNYIYFVGPPARQTPLVVFGQVLHHGPSSRYVQSPLTLVHLSTKPRLSLLANGKNPATTRS
jgi:hypothetical protein